MKYITYSLTLAIATLNFGCNQFDTHNLIGKWQSLNNPNVALEFTYDNKVDMFTHGEPLMSRTSKHGELTYSLKHLSDNWYQFRILDGGETFNKCKIEVVNRDRIRIYFFKQHDILDTSDEYHRTNDFNSFKKIMSKIMES